jgi:hypothetical protein
MAKSRARGAQGSKAVATAFRLSAGYRMLPTGGEAVGAFHVSIGQGF